jgi:hypothetical protein
MKHRSEIGQFCFCFWNVRSHVNFFADFVSVVTNECYVFSTSCCSWACHVSITDWFVPFIGWEYVDTWHIDTWHILIGRSTFTEIWSDGPPICEIWKKVTNWAGIFWHVACGHVADFDRTVHVYRAGTCHIEMINCKKVRLPRQICNFCVSAVSRMDGPSFLFLESAFFFIGLSKPQDCSDCDLELQTVSLTQLPQHPGKFKLREWAGLLSFWSDGPRV